MSRLFEAGHYYSIKGPTAWSVVGWNIMKKIITLNDGSLLFIDDVHTIQDVHPQERELPTQAFSPVADFTILESDMTEHAFAALDMLTKLPRKKRARKKEKQWFCSGFPITNMNGHPLCVLLDAGLTLKKNKLHYTSGINILPYYYEDQQTKLLRLIKKIIPNFHIQVILYDLDGNCWEM